jgi:hypothetical protein
MVVPVVADSAPGPTRFQEIGLVEPVRVATNGAAGSPTLKLAVAGEMERVGGVGVMCFEEQPTTSKVLLMTAQRLPK